MKFIRLSMLVLGLATSALTEEVSAEVTDVSESLLTDDG